MILRIYDWSCYNFCGEFCFTVIAVGDVLVFIVVVVVAAPAAAVVVVLAEAGRRDERQI